VGDKVAGPIDGITKTDLQGFIQAGLKERSRTTVGKERGAVIQIFRWAAGREYVGGSPAAELEKSPASRNQAHFRTAEEIEAVLSRGGLSREASWALWDCLYLTPGEAADLLAAVRERRRRDVSYLLHAIPAYTALSGLTPAAFAAHRAGSRGSISAGSGSPARCWRRPR
jgi:integrase